MMARLLILAPLLTVLSVAAMVTYIVFLKPPPPLPKMDLNAWWGPESLKSKVDDSVKAFKIKFGTDVIQNIKQRISVAGSFPPPLQGITHEYGFNTDELSDWLKFWSEEYDFSGRQRFLNQFQHYKTNVQGLDIHFMRVKPETPENIEVVPLLLLHGWPGSGREFYEAIPYLTAVQDGRDFALEVIVPSLPGYGFSDAAVRPGMGAVEVAVVMRNLMRQLGFNKYYVQGGDWGAIIGSHIATLFPDEVLGFHTNMPAVMTPAATLLEVLGSIYPSLYVDSKYADRVFPLGEVYSFLLKETGYMHLQATKPDTIGVALSDSVAGLLAYILEKFSTWTDRGLKPVTHHFTKEQLIDNLMFYEARKSITTSMRLYAETFNKRQFGLGLDSIPTPVPTWALQAKFELTYQPPRILKLKYPNLVNATILEDGGHFLAFQLPKIFASDVVKAIGEFRRLKKVKTEL